MSASILVVDDEEAIRASLRSILEDEGYDVSIAANGLEALKIYGTDPPDLMILDIWMPEMDGLEDLTAGERICAHDTGHDDLGAWIHRNGRESHQAGRVRLH